MRRGDVRRDMHLVRECPKFMGNPGRVYRQGGKDFFQEKKRGAKTFFGEKKGGQVFFSRAKKGGKVFFEGEKGGQKVFLNRSKWGASTFLVEKGEALTFLRMKNDGLDLFFSTIFYFFSETMSHN